MGGEVNRHINWKTVEAESREFALVNNVPDGLTRSYYSVREHG
jgi:hypothetical protein